MNPIQKHVLKRSETSEMTERELLMELVEEKRRAETWRYIHIAWNITLLIVVLFLAYKFLPGIIAFFKDLHDTVQSIKQTADQISQGFQSVADSLSEGGGLWNLFGSLSGN